MNLKEEFIKWFFDNANGRYSGLTSKIVSQDLEESEKYFNKDIFNVDELNIEQILNYLKNELYRKDSSFYNYSASVGHHRPKAILGNKNYIKFLQEKFNLKSQHSGDENNQKVEFYKIIKRLDAKQLTNYFSLLDEIKKKVKLTTGDERVDFSTASNKLGLVIGNRYCWNIKPLKNRHLYFAISPQKLIKSSSPFGQNGPLAFSTESEDFEVFEKNSDQIIEGVKNELTRTNVTRHKRNNKIFEKAVFDLAFRNKILGFANPETMKYISLNTILYGPPGTGKTYQLQDTYFNEFTVQETSLNREQYLENIVSDLKWWQVAAIVLLDLKKSKVTDIVSHELLLIKTKLSNSKNPNATIWGYLQHYTDPECEYVRVAERSSNPIFYKDQNSVWEVKEDLLEQFYPEAFSILEEVKNYHPNPEKFIKNYEFVTFHQSFSYEDFIEGIKPNLDDEENNVSYRIEDGIFKKMCLKADADRDNRYALFIDEINRGNVSAIFGELITLIEDDKRLGEENELRAKLPYSKTELGVPPNLHIFGTMNTADRSVEALDSALRRRFTFKEIMPEPHLLGHISFNGFDLKEVLETINVRIEALLDRDHTIGHSYLIKINSGDTEALKEAFENKIIPLLQEYFYHDYEKIALILGQGFVEKREGKVEFAKFNGLEDPEITPSYELKKGIEDIEAVVRKLLNRKDETAE